MKNYSQLKFPIKLVLVRQNDNNLYMFRSPSWTLEKGDQVVCKTKRGEQPGVVDATGMINSQESLDFIMKAARVDKLEPVLAKLRREDFGDDQTYRMDKGLEYVVPDAETKADRFVDNATTWTFECKLKNSDSDDLPY